VPRSNLELADIVRAHEADLIASRGGEISSVEARVLRAIARCRTAALGGHVEKCDRCSHVRISYNSCRNRHCPKCQGAARERWLQDRAEDLLPVEYFHVVFTLPHEIAALAIQNKRVIYELLFRVSAETLQEIAADPKHLGAEVGFLSVLHTWGQSLEHHPHVHMIVPGGGFSKDRTAWVSARQGFFVPVRVLARLFRGKFLAEILCAFEQKRLGFYGKLAHLVDPASFRAYLEPLYDEEWFVYSKPPFGGPEHVLRYLSRYTHRVAISNSRLVGFRDRKVSFLWKDYAHECKKRVMTLNAVEFLRRFLTHVLPKGFVRIRHYGFLANCRRRAAVDLSRKLLGCENGDQESRAGSAPVEPHDKVTPCPACKKGRMVIVTLLDPGDPALEHLEVACADTS
jgi:hypothetical protein